MVGGRGARTGAVALAFAGLLQLAPAPARAETSEPPAELIAEAFLGIQNHITNAGMKVRQGGMSGVGVRGRAPSATTSLIGACCGFNVEKIGLWIAHLYRVAEALELHYADERNRAALEQLHTMKTGLREVEQGVAIFARTTTLAQAGAALQGMIRPFNQAREASQALAACCPVPDGAVRVAPPSAQLRPPR
jgi:uncharacterized membrane protein